MRPVPCLVQQLAFAGTPSPALPSSPEKGATVLAPTLKMREQTVKQPARGRPAAAEPGFRPGRFRAVP